MKLPTEGPVKLPPPPSSFFINKEAARSKTELHVQISIYYLIQCYLRTSLTVNSICIRWEGRRETELSYLFMNLHYKYNSILV